MNSVLGDSINSVTYENNTLMVFPDYKLVFPVKFYGRNQEIQTLTDAFDNVCWEQQFMLISACAGCGKTRLVNESIKPLLKEKGYFITGKCDQLQLNEPYLPLIQAFRELIRQILTESEESLILWKKRLLRALGRNAAVISEVIPELELIVGPQSPVEELQPQESQHRFHIVFSKFVQVFAKKKNPLIIFLDDLQWIDAGSLQLIKYISQDTDRYLLLIGAYRDNEVTETHPLMSALAELQRKAIPFKHIKLESLNLYHSSQFIADSLNCSQEKVGPLSEVFYRKTGGNPFFLGQLLQFIYDEKILCLNNGSWDWELDKIEELQIADDLIELMLGRLQRLPEETLNVLKLAACIGNKFDIKTLAIICEKTSAQIGKYLMPALEEKLLLPLDQAGQVLFRQQLNSYVFPDEIKSCEFLHDRVQQSAYSLITEEEQQEVHLKLGRLLLENTDQQELPNRILSIIDHMNYGLNLIKDPAERLKLAEYNLWAGRKAKTSAAYDSALIYFKTAVHFLSADCWKKYYQLSYDLYIEWSQCEYLCGNFKEAGRLFDLILNYSKTNLERADIYGLKMVLNSGVGNYQEAIQLGLKALDQLGIHLTAKPGNLQFIKEIILSKWRLHHRKVEDLLKMPVLKDPQQKKLMNLMVLMAPSANMANPELFALIIFKMANISLKHLDTDYSAIAYAGYSIFAGSEMGDYASGYEFEKLAIKLSKKYSNTMAICIVYFMIGAFVSHWTQDARVGISYLQNSVCYGLESGELLYTGYAYTCIIENKYLSGDRLDQVVEECQDANIFACRMQHDNLIKNVNIYQELIQVLKSGKSDALLSKASDKDYLLRAMEDDNAALMAYYFAKMQLLYLYGNYENALAIAEKAEEDIDSIKGFLMSAEYNFYYSLIITSIYKQLSHKQQKKYWKILKRNQRQMKKWADSCAENFWHKYLLVAAEMARVSGKSSQAESCYDCSIQSAHVNAYLQNEAIANELAASYYLGAGRDKIARIYMADACQGYCSWGAIGKARALKEQYPELLDGLIVEEKNDKPVEEERAYFLDSVSAGDFSEDFNLDIILRTTRKLNKETDPARMLDGLLEIMMESSGANKAYLIMESSGELFIKASRKIDSPSGEQVTDIKLEKSDHLSLAIVRYVGRTQEKVVLPDREKAKIFARDTYIIKNQPQSVACIPLVLQGSTAGILYIENNQIAGVFTEERLEFLELLSAQMLYAAKLQTFSIEETASAEESPLPVNNLFTDRELEVLQLIASGMSNKQIAETLGVKLNTVKTHTDNIYGKLGVNRRVQAVSRAKELKIIE